MPKSVSDIIPEQFQPPMQRPPVEILRELRSDLGRRTRYKIRAEVNSATVGDQFVHSFVLTVPELDYSGDLFRVVNPASFYPAEIRGSAVVETSPTGVLGVSSEDELIEALGRLFRSKKTK